MQRPDTDILGLWNKKNWKKIDESMEYGRRVFIKSE